VELRNAAEQNANKLELLFVTSQAVSNSVPVSWQLDESPVRRREGSKITT
jgi:hypothetical protein